MSFDVAVALVALALVAGLLGTGHLVSLLATREMRAEPAECPPEPPELPGRASGTPTLPDGPLMDVRAPSRRVAAYTVAPLWDRMPEMVYHTTVADSGEEIYFHESKQEEAAA